MRYLIFFIFHFGGCRSKFVILISVICIFVHMDMGIWNTEYELVGWNSVTWDFFDSAACKTAN
jgi:hypothetical protein